TYKRPPSKSAVAYVTPTFDVEPLYKTIEVCLEKYEYTVSLFVSIGSVYHGIFWCENLNRTMVLLILHYCSQMCLETKEIY
ncbi:hypothetical protein, partial [Bacillus seohaeanensis]